MTFWDLKFFWGIKRDLSIHLHLDLFQGWFVSEEISCVWLSIIEIGTWSSFSPQYWRPSTKLRKIGIFCISTYLHICYCAFFLRYILCWFLMIAYDCINLTHSPCGIWTMVENWHTTVMVTIQILWSALSIVVFFVSLFILLVSILNGMSTNRLQLFFLVVFIIIIIFLLGSGYIMKRRCWRPDKKYQPARNWGRGRCNLSNVPKWT